MRYLAAPLGLNNVGGSVTFTPINKFARKLVIEVLHLVTSTLELSAEQLLPISMAILPLGTAVEVDIYLKTAADQPALLFVQPVRLSSVRNSIE